MAARGRAERVPETLIFATPEEAAAWRERVEERLSQPGVRGVRRAREAVAETVAEEFVWHGEAVVYTQPWEHTAAEHQAVQQLVDVAFTADLAAALRQARRHDLYPRLIDLLHDVLAGQLYEVVVQERLNRQRLMGRLRLGVIGALGLLVAAGLVFWWGVSG